MSHASKPVVSLRQRSVSIAGAGLREKESLMREADLVRALGQTTNFSDRQQLLKQLWRLRQEAEAASLAERVNLQTSQFGPGKLALLPFQSSAVPINMNRQKSSDVIGNAAGNQSPGDAARKIISDSTYPEIRRLSAVFGDGVLTLTGAAAQLLPEANCAQRRAQHCGCRTHRAPHHGE